MYHIASCPWKYKDNEDSQGVLEHNPLKSSYDTPQPTKYSVHSGNDNSAKLFEVEMNDREGIDNDRSCQHSIDGSDSDINTHFDSYKK
jgi:hypothetical protein